MAKIFISYSHDDSALLEKIRPQLSNIYGRDSYWYDQDGIPGGADWEQEIEGAIVRCEVFLFLVSENSVKSDYCIKEIRIALRNHKKILSVVLPDFVQKLKDVLETDLYEKLTQFQYVKIEDFVDLSRVWHGLNNLIFAPQSDDTNGVKTSTIDFVERWKLHNQYEILSLIAGAKSQASPEHYEQAMSILARGYEWHYDDISQFIDKDTFTRSQSLEVIDILDMFRSLKYSYENLDDTSDIDTTFLHFFGFDGNYETVYLAYTRFQIEEYGNFEELRPQNGYNSHMPSLHIYRAMVAEWKRSQKKYKLTKDEIIRITSVTA